MSRTYDAEKYDSTNIITYPPKDLLVTEEYLNSVLTVENIYTPANLEGQTPKIVITEANGKVPLTYFNVANKKIPSNPSNETIVTIKSQNDTDQPDTTLKGTIDRDILGTYNDNKGRLLALDGSGNLPSIIEGYEVSNPNEDGYIKSKDSKLDSSWLRGTINQTNTSDISNNNKIVFTRSDSNTIDPSLLNIQRLVVKLSTATQAYTLGTSFEMPSDKTKHLYIYLNGMLLAPTEDYSISNRTITFRETLPASSILQFIAIA